MSPPNGLNHFLARHPDGAGVAEGLLGVADDDVETVDLDEVLSSGMELGVGDDVKALDRDDLASIGEVSRVGDDVETVDWDEVVSNGMVLGVGDDVETVDWDEVTFNVDDVIIEDNDTVGVIFLLVPVTPPGVVPVVFLSVDLFIVVPDVLVVAPPVADMEISEQP